VKVKETNRALSISNLIGIVLVFTGMSLCYRR